MVVDTKRGPYAKGLARRAQILEAALAAYASSGPQGPSLRSIADTVGLTEAGVLHYFDSKDELLVEILAARDRADVAAFDLTTLEGAWALLEHATHTPGLVKLFLDMTVASASADHPARELMQRRAHTIFDIMGRFYSEDEPWKPRVMLAAAEGLQIQWLRDPSVDIVADLRLLHEQLLGCPRERPYTKGA
ncbi:TetR/AcrR family transcriptional regulator [Catenulispora rubra]|uniref:TetR/AcrR family transcriptional regulator n=1 Tax=Catenulispora rubra TaxID=280293 RepID=UPI0018923D57|nr:TetR/AcrR family transcriptional regulator [Catenulispora rubra]